MSIRREEARIRRLIERILVVSLAVPAASAGAIAACSAGTSSDAADSKSAASSAGTGAGGQAPSPDGGGAAVTDGCEPQSVQIDAGDDGSCSYFLAFPCGMPPGIVPQSDVTPISGCYFGYNDCQTLCGGDFVFNCHAFGDSCSDAGLTDARPTILECVDCPNGVGRRPRGLVAPRAMRGGVGAYFARAAHLEAASVHAFRVLEQELADHGAPRDLVAAADRGARDEVRHARMMSRLAARWGARPPPVVVRARAQRSLEAIALDNATEGCVRETFGALIAAWQADRTRDPEVAAIMRAVARDEARHAAMSWAVARWAASQLDAGQAERVTRAMRRAAADLARSAAEPDPELVRVAGVPRARERRALARLFAREIAPPPRERAVRRARCAS